MLERKPNILLTAIVLAFVIQACGPLSSTTEPGLAPTRSIEPVFTASQAGLPGSEAAVLRISVEAAKAALDSGAAISVDVRSAGAYEASHIPGALNIPLAEFETNPTDLNLEKAQWIITYCT